MRFDQFIGIDYSGASHADAGLKGLRVYRATPDSAASEITPPRGRSKYWTRRGVAQWLLTELEENTSLVGIDHGFSAPEEYFSQNCLPRDWYTFLSRFTDYWMTDRPGITVDHIRKKNGGEDREDLVSAKWRRICEQRCGAKSIFHFDVPGSVAKSTHAGLIWLRFLAEKGPSNLHFWPFDGWHIGLKKSVIVEAYPSLYRRKMPSFHQSDMTDDQRDACIIADWLRSAYLQDNLLDYFSPTMNSVDLKHATYEGWILGL